jgi:hypothetical protein
MFHRFAFESEFYPTLSRIPVHVRMKLDLTGIKISLDDWLAFSFEERHVLCHLPAEKDDERQAFIFYVDYLCRKYRGQPPAKTAPLSRSIWDKSSSVPEPVLQKSSTVSRSVTPEEWLRWRSFQRYALYKTAVSKNEPGAFLALLIELRESGFDAQER